MSATDNRLDKTDTALGDTLAPPVPGDFNATLDSLVSERGGPAAFSPSQPRRLGGSPGCSPTRAASTLRVYPCC
jgi:hypothetical protein